MQSRPQSDDFAYTFKTDRELPAVPKNGLMEVHKVWLYWNDLAEAGYEVVFFRDGINSKVSRIASAPESTKYVIYFEGGLGAITFGSHNLKVTKS